MPINTLNPEKLNPICLNFVYLNQKEDTFKSTCSVGGSIGVLAELYFKHFFTPEIKTE